MAKCKSCGADIIWIKTDNGKSMPCDADQVLYLDVKWGTETIVTPNGQVLKCEFTNDPDEASGVGHLPHWATCPYADRHRKKK